MVSQSGIGMMSFVSYRKFCWLGLATAVGMALVIGSAGSGARAADDEDDLPDVKAFRYIMKGLGLRRDEAGIEYRERSPLVLPPSKDLPAPQTIDPAKKAAGWPDDPDVKRVKQRKEAERKRKSFEPGVDDKPLLPNQYGSNAPATTGTKAGEAPGRSMEGSAAPSTNAELGSKGLKGMLGGLWAPKEEYTAFTGEPARSSLTEPPPGYRTPSPAQPYGVGREKWVAPSVDKNEPVK